MNLSIIVPTYNEGDNVKAIVDRIMKVMTNVGYSYEILFVDDSDDQTPLELKKLAQSYNYVRYYHRDNMRGLGTAAVEGFKRARGQYLIVMDADLQHPPELIPEMVEVLDKGINLVIPSRFLAGGYDGGLNWQRKIVSWTARTLARIALKKARPVSDCTGGFFGLHRNVVEGISLNPIGWKILLEIIVKGSYKSFEEIPYAFHARQANLSKMNFKEQYNYIKHIVALVAFSPTDRRFFLFCSIGALGMLVNMLFFLILMDLSNNQVIISSFTASSVAMVHNYIWNDLVTWKDIKNYRHIKRFPRFLRFGIVSIVGIAITALVVKIFTTLNWNPYLGQFTGILTAVTWNFIINNRWTWAETIPIMDDESIDMEE